MAINTTNSISLVSAIATMCSYLGVPAPIDANVITSDPDWIRAQGILNATTREALHKGLEFNQDTDYTLNQEVDGTVLIPAGTLRWVVVNDWEERYTERDNKVYDAVNQTDVISADLVVNIVWDITFDSMPEMIKNYLTIKSAYRFVARLKGSDSVLQTIQQDLDDANYEYLRYQGRTNGMSLLDNYEVHQIASRHLDYNHSYR